MSRARPRRKAHKAGVRALAARVLLEVQQGRSLNECLAAGQERVRQRDKSLLAELAYGSCRWFHQLQALLDLLIERPLRPADADIQALLMIGCYQLLHSRIPDHAAIGETAAAARELRKSWAVGLVNGVLRRLQRERERLLPQVIKKPAVRWSLPQWLLASLRKDRPEHWPAIAEGLLQRPPFTIRVDLRRHRLADYAALLIRQGVACRPLPGFPAALVLDQAVPAFDLPGFDQGWASVQDAGAQLAAPLLDPQPGMRVLDACAAPGGKTGHLLQWQPDIDCVALDVDKRRLHRVAENLLRLGHKAHLQLADASRPEGDWARRRYHRILLDAPCSATGVIRRHPDIKLLRQPGDIDGLVARQRDMLEALWPLLERGGRLLYATCSILCAENQQQVEWFLDRHSEARCLPLSHPQAAEQVSGMQLLPETRSHDGFFYALLEKQ